MIIMNINNTFKETMKANWLQSISDLIIKRPNLYEDRIPTLNIYFFGFRYSTIIIILFYNVCI